MLALYIVGGIVLFLFLLLIIPVRVTFTMTEQVGLAIGYGPIHITLLPGKEKEKKPKKPKKPKAEKKPKEKEEGKEKKPSFLKKLQEKHGISGLVSLAGQLIKLATGTFKRFLSHIALYHFHLSVAVGSDNAADTAVQASKLTAIIDSALSVALPLIPKNKRRDIQWNIFPDFTAEKSNIQLYAKAGILPLFVFSTIFGALFRFIWIYIKASKEATSRNHVLKQLEKSSKKAV